MPRAKTAFHLRLDSDLLADLRAVSITTGASMTSHIEDALHAYLPAKLANVSPTLVAALREANG